MMTVRQHRLFVLAHLLMVAVTGVFFGVVIPGLIP